MSRNLAQRTAIQKTITMLTPAAAAAEARRFVPREKFQQLPFWAKLDAKIQTYLQTEGNQIASIRIVEGTCELALGMHISHVHEKLEGIRGAFPQYCWKLFGLKQRTAYRYKQKYEEALETFPQAGGAIVRVAMTRGMDIPGKYKEAIKMLPPTRALSGSEVDENAANRYLDQLETTYKEGVRARNKRNASKHSAMSEARHDPEALKISTYRTGKNAMRHLSTAKAKRSFLDTIVGMWMSDLGIGSPTTFSPEAVPSKYKQERGRPSHQAMENSLSTA